MVINQLGLVDI